MEIGFAVDKRVHNPKSVSKVKIRVCTGVKSAFLEEINRSMEIDNFAIMRSAPLDFVTVEDDHNEDEGEAA